MYSKEQQLRRGGASQSPRQSASDHGREEDAQSWDLEIVPRVSRSATTPAPLPATPATTKSSARPKQEYKPATPGHKHVLVRNMKRETYDKLHTLASARFNHRDVNWLINHILDAYE